MLLESGQDVFGYRSRLFIGDGLGVELGHAGAGIAHLRDDVLLALDAIGSQCLLVQAFLGVDDVAAFRMAVVSGDVAVSASRGTLLTLLTYSRLRLGGRC